MPRPTRKKVQPTTLRIISGALRGRKVLYTGDTITRPMRDSVRESLFNVLFHTFSDSLTWDLFAGTGVLAMESISRGAKRSIAIEQDRSACDAIRRSLDALGITSQIELINGDAFRIAPRLMASGDTSRRWIVFVCPPYELMTRRPEAIVDLVQIAFDTAPDGSFVAVEMDDHWDADQLPAADWDIRRYGSTRLAFAEVPGRSAAVEPEAVEDGTRDG